MPFCINNEKQLEKCKTIWTKIEDLKNAELNALPVYDDIRLDNMANKFLLIFVV